MEDFNTEKQRFSEYSKAILPHFLEILGINKEYGFRPSIIWVHEDSVHVDGVNGWELSVHEDGKAEIKHTHIEEINAIPSIGGADDE